MLLPAAGSGKRLRGPGPKALVDLAGRPLIVRTLSRFAPLGMVDDAVIVTPPEHKEAFALAIGAAFPDASPCFVDGASERQYSVEAGLAALNDDTEFVAIHDAARPFVDADTIEETLREAATHGAATVATPCVDTILEGDDTDFLAGAADRSRLWACQTPQVFRVDVIRAAHESARRTGFTATDDATLVRADGGAVKLVKGPRSNFKITTPEDLAYATYLIETGAL